MSLAEKTVTRLEAFLPPIGPRRSRIISAANARRRGPERPSRASRRLIRHPLRPWRAATTPMSMRLHEGGVDAFRMARPRRSAAPSCTGSLMESSHGQRKSRFWNALIQARHSVSCRRRRFAEPRISGSLPTRRPMRVTKLEPSCRRSTQCDSSRRPIGPVGVITPWNTPFMLSTWKIAPALAAGCTVVHKPAELSPITASILMEIAEEAGLPPGVWNLVNGMGEEAGRR